ncbi:SusC/RagA family TonB-linked outer membrane protein [Aureibaculum marinum]|uniref:SusC/RagA family TonB-linked outer membrane protein n=1 Tax=Aureibaculum marinum TaxID=2487930 RepID=A0A3N4NK87_9FLAO|nr:SusC/RagA family TonB-linked outer membrane protein [Aureibaculum marinum]RPD96744.1 SusC/RagA family TonB-linked outer membrane protein [Aureibaculum marinum]
MRKKFKISFLILFTTTYSFLFAQSITVSGTVTDASGMALPSVSIQVKGTATGTSTDFDGNYQISASEGDILVFSYLGFKTKEIQISGSTLNVSLEEDAATLDEVVVTAMGISREKKSIGYSVQELKSEDLLTSPESNIVNALSGKIAGAQVSSQGGAPGQGSRIIIRGVNSLDPNADNQPLFIVDGVPISNDQFTVGGGSGRGATNRGADINMEDVENLTVLKGGAATALYGVRAANGAVIITTRKGKDGKALFSISATTTFDEVNKFPETQNKYTQGYNGEYDPNSFWPSWGSSIEEARAIDPTHPEKIYNNYKNAYGTGFSNNLHFSGSGGNDKATFYSSFSRFEQEGVLEFSSYKKTGAKIAGDLKLSDKFKVFGSLDYVNSGGPRINTSNFNERLVYWAPRVDVNDYEFTEGPLAGTMKGYRNDGAVGNNPVYGNKVNKYVDNVDRFFGNLGFNFTPFEGLNVNYRFGMDTYTDKRTATAPGRTGIQGENYFEDNSDGYIVETRILSKDLTSNLMVSYNKELSDKFDLTLRAGFDVFQRSYDRVTTSGDELEVYNLFHLSNAALITTSQLITKTRTAGVYGELGLAYDNFLFLTITDRNDWASTLPEDNRSFNYPSVSLGYVFTESIDMPNWFSYGKLRGSWAQIGKDAVGAYLTSDVYRATANNFPVGDVTGWTRPGNKADPELQSELTTEIEFGAEFRFFNSRLGLDVTWYKSNAENQILGVPVSYSSGYDSFTTNAGEIENRGIEIMLNATPIRTEDFSWNFNVNYSSNKNEVVEIKEGIDNIFLDSNYGYAGSTASQVLYPGYSYGNILGRSYMRYYENPADEDPLVLDKSRPLLIGDDGFPIINTTQKILGNSTPDWMMNIGNEISYKNLTLGFNFDFRQGFEKFNNLDNFFSAFGTAPYTENREETIVFEGVTADGTPNTKPVYLGQGVGPDGVNYGAGFYRNTYRGSTENFIEDASWIRLKNVRLTYNLPQKILDKTVLSNASLTATGTNLWLKTDYSGFDPEASESQGNADGFAGLGAYPGLRSYALTLRLTF